MTIEQEIAEWLGFEPCEDLAVGFKLAIVVYERPAKKEQSLIELPKAVTDEDKWIRPVGRVIKMGKEAYKTGKWEDGKVKPLCKLGDWVHFGRHEGYMLNYREKPIMIIADDRVGGITSDPSYISKF